MNKSGMTASFTDRLVKRFQLGVDWMHTWISVIKPCRFSLIMVGAGAFFLLLVRRAKTFCAAWLNASPEPRQTIICACFSS
jgi:hypothetical protein